jgi:hypothetical protein
MQIILALLTDIFRNSAAETETSWNITGQPAFWPEFEAVTSRIQAAAIIWVWFRWTQLSPSMWFQKIVAPLTPSVIYWLIFCSTQILKLKTVSSLFPGHFSQTKTCLHAQIILWDLTFCIKQLNACNITNHKITHSAFSCTGHSLLHLWFNIRHNFLELLQWKWGGGLHGN